MKAIHVGFWLTEDDHRTMTALARANGLPDVPTLYKTLGATAVAQLAGMRTPASAPKKRQRAAALIITDELIATVRDMREQRHLNRAAVAEELGLSVSSVSRIAAAGGIVFREPSTERVLTEVEQEQLKAMHLARATQPQIAQEFGIGKKTVALYLDRLGLAPWPRGRASEGGSVTDPTELELLAEGLTEQAVARLKDALEPLVGTRERPEAQADLGASPTSCRVEV